MKPDCWPNTTLEGANCQRTLDPIGSLLRSPRPTGIGAPVGPGCWYFSSSTQALGSFSWRTHTLCRPQRPGAEPWVAEPEPLKRELRQRWHRERRVSPKVAGRCGRLCSKLCARQSNRGGDGGLGLAGPKRTLRWAGLSKLHEPCYPVTGVTRLRHRTTGASLTILYRGTHHLPRALPLEMVSESSGLPPKCTTSDDRGAGSNRLEHFGACREFNPTELCRPVQIGSSTLGSVGSSIPLNSVAPFEPYVPLSGLPDPWQCLVARSR